LLPISADRIAAALNTQKIGGRIVYRPLMTSTMVVAQEEIAAASPHGSVILCQRQEHGIGRMQRQWISPEGGVYLSVILYPPEYVCSALTMLASLAVADSIEEVCGCSVDLKWPNDVLIGNKKVSGILACSGMLREGTLWAVVGIGINANIDTAELPEDLRTTVTSLSETCGREISREQLIIKILQELERRYQQFLAGEMMWAEWEKRLITIGREVVVHDNSQTYSGFAESIDKDGALVIRRENGKLVTLSAGDVTLKEN